MHKRRGMNINNDQTNLVHLTLRVKVHDHTPTPSGGQACENKANHIDTDMKPWVSNVGVTPYLRPSAGSVKFRHASSLTLIHLPPTLRNPPKHSIWYTWPPNLLLFASSSAPRRPRDASRDDTLEANLVIATMMSSRHTAGPRIRPSPGGMNMIKLVRLAVPRLLGRSSRRPLEDTESVLRRASRCRPLMPRLFPRA